MGGLIVFFVMNQAGAPAVIITDYESCAEAPGSVILESFPEQCRSEDGQSFTRELTDEERKNLESPEEETPQGGEKSEEEGVGYVECKPEQRGAEACILLYSPVCAQVQVECITTPCPPVEEEFGNSCLACANERVLGYVEGMCN